MWDDQNISAIMLGFIGKPVLLTTRFGTDERGDVVSYSGTSDRYYKVDRKEGLSETALIVIIVVLVIAVIAIIASVVVCVIKKPKSYKPFASV